MSAAFRPTCYTSFQLLYVSHTHSTNTYTPSPNITHHPAIMSTRPQPACSPSRQHVQPLSTNASTLCAPTCLYPSTNMSHTLYTNISHLFHIDLPHTLRAKCTRPARKDVHTLHTTMNHTLSTNMSFSLEPTCPLPGNMSAATFTLMFEYAKARVYIAISYACRTVLICTRARKCECPWCEREQTLVHLDVHIGI